ncbi:MAG: OmpA family protein [Pseudomonadota bacterium]
MKGKSDSKSTDSGTTTPPITVNLTEVSAGQDLDAEALGENRAKAAQAGLTGPGQDRVHFAYDSDHLTNDSLKLLRRHAAFLKADPGIRASLEGHTDERGTAEYNLALGERRAKTVAVFLQTQGVSPAQLEVATFGELKPVVEGETEESHAQNRRVEILYR